MSGTGSDLLDERHALDELTPGSLRELLRLLEAAGVEELEVEAAGGRLSLRRAPAAPARLSEAPRALPAEPVVVGSPAVGVFRRSADDGAPPLAAEGDIVRRGQVLAVVEVLRMPHPVEAPVAGRLERFLVESGQPAEYGQPLLVLVPSDQEASPTHEQGGGT